MINKSVLQGLGSGGDGHLLKDNRSPKILVMKAANEIRGYRFLCSIHACIANSLLSRSHWQWLNVLKWDMSVAIDIIYGRVRKKTQPDQTNICSAFQRTKSTHQFRSTLCVTA